MSDVSVLGTGLMGAAIARTFLRHGLSVTVWNRSPEKAVALRADGASVAGSATEAMLASPVSVLVILSYDNVREILEDALQAGSVGDVINLVTGSPAEADELSTWASERTVHVLDGALLTYPRGIGGSDTVVLYSGEPAVWDRRQDLLMLLGGGSQYLGEAARLANAMDHVTLSFVTITQTAIFSTLAYAEVLGVPRAAAVERIEASLRTIRGTLRHTLPMIETRDFRTSEATVDTWVLSSSDFASGWRESGLPGRAIAAAAETIKAAQQAGLGDLDLAAVYAYELGQATQSL